MRPHVPHAWIATTRREHQNGEVGLLGWESNLKRYPYYEYRPPRPLEGNEADIQRVEKEIVAMLAGDVGLMPPRHGQLVP